MIYEAGDNLIKIINELLDWEKMEKEIIEINEEPMKLREVIENITGVYVKKLNRKGVELDVKIGEEIPDVLIGDKEKLVIILDNLMSNAVKFTENGKITVAVKRMTENAQIVDLEFMVKDTGKGMKREEADRIFNPFMQGDSSYTKR